jgi:hypothetical protein
MASYAVPLPDPISGVYDVPLVSDMTLPANAEDGSFESFIMPVSRSISYESQSDDGDHSCLKILAPLRSKKRSVRVCGRR